MVSVIIVLAFLLVVSLAINIALCRIITKKDKDKKLMAKDIIDLMEALASDSEKNGDAEGVYYYRSAIPFIKTYYGIKGENKDE